MTYQVLARKWRPKRFADLVGQEHVVKALVNALDKGRLHHAYLLTGTRGVGKTTIARILAKSLNCAHVQHGEPCGVCECCLQIDAGRYVDVLEIDAASNTGIDNIREVLENAQYAPTMGKYKVYIIDEVHMLSKSAFNAMLKTLEEPPEHVKFILATTDPQKVPITVLSRCLQFVLRNLNGQQIHDHLAHVLHTEQIEYEDTALHLLGRAAGGSMRDALSLLDQAIAIGSGQVTEADVRHMIGAVDKRYLYDLLGALAARNGEALLAQAAQMASRAIGFDNALSELALLLQRLALLQAVSGAIAPDDPERDTLLALLPLFSGEQLQLYYQCALRGKQDLPLAPDEYAGFTMTLLRMLAFAPMAAAAQPPQGHISGTTWHDPEAAPAAKAVAASQPAPIHAAAAAVASERAESATSAAPTGQQVNTAAAVQTAQSTVAAQPSALPENEPSASAQRVAAECTAELLPSGSHLPAASPADKTALSPDVHSAGPSAELPVSRAVADNAAARAAGVIHTDGQAVTASVPDVVSVADDPSAAAPAIPPWEDAPAVVPAEDNAPSAPTAVVTDPAESARTAAPNQPAVAAAAVQTGQPEQPTAAETQLNTVLPEQERPAASLGAATDVQPASPSAEVPTGQTATGTALAASAANEADDVSPPLPPLIAEHWAEILSLLSPQLGALQLFSQHTAIAAFDDQTGALTLALAPQGEATADKTRLARLATILSAAYHRPIHLHTQAWQDGQGWETPAMYQQRRVQETRAQAQQLLEADTTAQDLISTFSATWVPESLTLKTATKP